jgi:FkbM family methyltransferase
VYAIEPDPTSFSTLNANVRLNPAAAAKTRLFFECIAAEAAAAAEFVGSGDGSSRSAAAVGDAGLRGGSGWTVPCRTLPDFIAAEGVDVEQLALVKLDVVGMELSVLASLKGFLAARRTKPAILLTVYAPAWKRDDGSDHALRLAAAWEIASSYKFLYDERLEPLGKDARTFCATAGCRMLLSDTAYLGPSGDA